MAEPLRRSLRSAAKPIADIPLPERRAAPKKKVQIPQDQPLESETMKKGV